MEVLNNKSVSKETLKNASFAAMTSAALALIIHVVTAHVSREGLVEYIRPLVDGVIKATSPKIVDLVATASFGTPLMGDAAVNHVSKLARGTVSANAGALIAHGAIQVYHYGMGSISGGQAARKVSEGTLGTVVGVSLSSYGFYVGGLGCNFLLPGSGFICGAAGSAVGTMVASYIAGYTSDTICDWTLGPTDIGSN
jgi:hypothetical protein